MSAEEQTLRLFVALPVPSEIKSSFATAQSRLRDLLPRGSASWTRPENMHLTLRFLGDVSSSQLEPLTAKLAAATAGFGALPLVAERLGCFPDLRYPRVVWAWVHDAADRLAEFQQRVVTATNDYASSPPESRFVGHVTLARLRQIKRPEAETVAAFVNGAVNQRFGEWTVDRLELIRSELAPSGSRYTTLATFPLA